MQRPRSEGRTVATSPVVAPPRERMMLREHHPLSQSLDAVTWRHKGADGNNLEEEELVEDEAPVRVNGGDDHDGPNAQATTIVGVTGRPAAGGLPRRPRTTPVRMATCDHLAVSASLKDVHVIGRIAISCPQQRGRVQRIVLGPGVSASGQAREPPAPAIFMTHLPDSPPRILVSSNARSTAAPSVSPPRRGDDDETEGAPQQGPNPLPSPKAEFSWGTTQSPECSVICIDALSSPEDVDRGQCEFVEENGVNHGGQQEPRRAKEQPEGPDVASSPCVNRRTAEETPGELGVGAGACTRGGLDPALDGPRIGEEAIGPEVDEEADEGDSEGDAPGSGPHLQDLAMRSATSSVPWRLSGSDDRDEPPTGHHEPQVPDADDANYQRLLEVREKLLEEEARREHIRRELESYVTSLSARRDEDGEQLLAFPKNYQQILALMTERDLRADGPLVGAPATSSPETPDKDSRRQKTWYEILIQNSLSKQQAYGILDDAEGGEDGESGLAAKIALKMARIRQLDSVLEEKLGKNLYGSNSTAATTSKQLQKASDSRDGPRTFVTQPQSITKASTPSGPGAPLLSHTPANGTRHTSASGLVPGSMNFIERNKQVIENGANPKLTRDEEERLRVLLDDVTDQVPDAIPTKKEFALDERDKAEIDRLILEKRGAYQSPLLPPQDDTDLDDGERRGDPSFVRGKAGHRKPNVVQENKKERLRQLRLQKIEEELRFLHEHEVVPILPDGDADETESCFDGCQSERSFVSTTSMLSTCSTRSGVTRRQLDQFVALEVSKSNESRAAPAEIERLLRSLSHVSVSRPPSTMSV